jgi:RimJ/RimL family protein N-acetyltransferase
MKEFMCTGQFASVRLLQAHDVEAYLTVFSPEIRAALGVTSVEVERIYIYEELAKQEQGRTFFFGIVDSATKVIVGAIEIRNKIEHAGQLYCWLHERYWGTGVFQDALSIATYWYFLYTQESYITARVNVSNKRSYRALKKCGFIDSGIIQSRVSLQYEMVFRRLSAVDT